MLFPKDLAYQI